MATTKKAVRKRAAARKPITHPVTLADVSAALDDLQNTLLQISLLVGRFGQAYSGTMDCPLPQERRRLVRTNAVFCRNCTLGRI